MADTKEINNTKNMTGSREMDSSISVTTIFFKVLAYVVFALFAFLTIYPLIWLFMSSFKPTVEIIKYPLSLPKEWIISNYRDAIKIGQLGEYALNSIIYTGIATTFTIIFSMMASFAFAKIKFRVTKFFYNVFLTGLLITIHSILVPLFLAINMVGLYDTRISIIIVYIAINLPLAVYLGTDYIKAIPDSVIESARIDGAGYMRIFFSMILPICRPVVVTIAIMTVLACWNEFALVFILTSSDSTRSLPVGIYKFAGPFATEYGMQFAALVLGTVPLIIFYVLFNKSITQGMIAGSVKG